MSKPKAKVTQMNEVIRNVITDIYNAEPNSGLQKVRNQLAQYRNDVEFLNKIKLGLEKQMKLKKTGPTQRGELEKFSLYIKQIQDDPSKGMKLAQSLLNLDIEELNSPKGDEIRKGLENEKKSKVKF